MAVDPFSIAATPHLVGTLKQLDFCKCHLAHKLLPKQNVELGPELDAANEALLSMTVRAEAGFLAETDLPDK